MIDKLSSSGNSKLSTDKQLKLHQKGNMPTGGPATDLNLLRVQGYDYIAKINNYVVCFTGTPTSFKGEVILDGSDNNYSWLSTAAWLEVGKLYKIDDVLSGNEFL